VVAPPIIGGGVALGTHSAGLHSLPSTKPSYIHGEKRRRDVMMFHECIFEAKVYGDTPSTYWKYQGYKFVCEWDEWLKTDECRNKDWSDDTTCK
jgi:hypothetical protein